MGKSRAEYMRDYRLKKREERLKTQKVKPRKVARSSTERSRDFRARLANSNSEISTADPSNSGAPNLIEDDFQGQSDVPAGNDTVNNDCVIKKPRLKLTAIPSQKLPGRQNVNEESIEIKIECPSPNEHSEDTQENDSFNFADVIPKIKQEKLDDEEIILQDSSLIPSGHAQLNNLTEVPKKLPLGIGFLSRFKWLNEPREWSFKNNILTLKSEDKTDFWQGTWYNSFVNTGHVYGVELKDDFTVEVCVEGGFESLNDQAGLMLYVDEKHWLKAGIEYNKDQPMIGSILTNEVSDWATGVFQGDTSKFWLRLTKMGNVVCVKYSLDNTCWHSLRLSTFPVFDKYFVGPMCCTPEKGGMIVKFSHLTCSRVPPSRVLQ